MRHVLFISLIFLLKNYCSFSQVNNLKEYFNNINKAELFICESNFKEASKYYAMSFNIVNVPFTKDIHNALVCDLLINKIDSFSVSYLKSLVYRGVSAQYYCNKFPNALKYANEKVLFNNFQIDTNKSLYNLNFKNFLDSIIFVDQKYRKQCISYQDHCIKGVITQDSINLKKLILFFTKNGFIDESGCIMYSPFNPPPYAILFKHWLQWEQNREFVLKYLEDYLQKGLVSPHFFSDCYDYVESSFKTPENKKMLGSQYYVEVDGELVIWYPDSKSEEDINQIREHYYLEPINDLLRKILFQKEHPEFCFLQQSYIGNIIGLPLEVKSTLIKEAKETEKKYKKQ